MIFSPKEQRFPKINPWHWHWQAPRVTLKKQVPPIHRQSVHWSVVDNVDTGATVFEKGPAEDVASLTVVFSLKAFEVTSVMAADGVGEDVPGLRLDCSAVFVSVVATKVDCAIGIVLGGGVAWLLDVGLEFKAVGEVGLNRLLVIVDFILAEDCDWAFIVIDV